MSRKKRRRIRALPHVSVLARLFWGTAAVVPPAVLLVQGGGAFLRLVDGTLKQAAPLVSAEASRQLQRPVSIGKLTPDLSVGMLWEALTHRDSLGSLPVGIYDITVLNRPGLETRQAGGPLLARVQSVTLLVSLPALLSGDTTGAISRIVVESPEVVAVRDANNRFNLQNIVPQKPNAKPSAPFRTYVKVSNGRVRFRDFAALRPKPELPADNRFANINGFVDLSGSRTIRFDVTARADSKSVTAKRFGGILSASGEAGRGLPKIRPNAPAPESARFLVRLYVGDVDVPYWANYFVKTPGFVVRTGRADLNLALIAPRPPKPTQPIPGIGVTLGANLRGVGLTADTLPIPLDNASGRFTYNDGSLDFSGGATVLGERVTTSGSLWNLVAQKKNGPPPSPQAAVYFNAPRIPVEKAVALLTPKTQKLPPGLFVGGLASASGTLSGPVKNFIVAAKFAGVSVKQKGLPKIQNIAADVTYTGGLVGANNVRAQIEGGGQVAGRAAVRIAGLPVTSKGNAVFAAQAQNVNLATLEALQAFGRRPSNARFKLSGRGNVEVVGQRVGGQITAAANVAAQNLRVGDLAFPVARARVLVKNNSFVIPSARIESPAGIVSVSGGINPDQSLAVKWAVSSLDLAPLGKIAGVTVRGLVSSSGTVSGTVASPRLTISDLVGLNLRYAQATSDRAKTRRFALDVARGQNIIVTKEAVTFARPFVLRRFPASLTIGGSVSNFLPTGNAPASAAFNPRLNLYARLQNLDFTEIQNQLAASDRVRIRQAARNLPAALTPRNTGDAPFGGLVKNVTLRVVGTAQNPQAEGTATFDRLFVGDYPIDSGSVLFSYNKNRTRIDKAKLAASVGTITASGTLAASGKLSGKFAAPDLDLAKVSFLTGATNLSGKVSFSGTAGGSLQNPDIAVSVAPSDVSVGGISLQGISAQNVRYVGGANHKPGRIVVPRIAFAKGDARFTLSEASYNVQTGAVSAALSARTGDLGTLVQNLQQGGLNESEAGAQVLSALSRLPAPLSGELSLDTNVRGSIIDAGGGKKRFVGEAGKLTLSGTNVQIGGFVADTISTNATLAGDKITLSQFLAKTPSATLRGSGTYNIATSEGQGLLETNEASLDLVRSFPGLETFPLYGTLSGATIQLETSRKTGLSVTASTEGKNLVYVPPLKTAKGNQSAAEIAVAAVLNAPKPGSPEAKALNAAATGEAGAEGTPKYGSSVIVANAVASGLLRPGITVGSVRTILRLTQTGGNTTLFVDDFLLSRGEAELRVEGSLPLALNADETVANRPINLRATIPQFSVANLLQDPLTQIPEGDKFSVAAPKKRGGFLSGLFKKKTPAEKKQDEAKNNLPQLGGTAEASLTLVGTLKNPLLNGNLRIVDGQFRLGRSEGQSRDAVSPISDLDADLVIDNSQITLQKLRAELGGVSGQSGGYGTVSVGGTVTLDDLANLQSYLRPAPKGESAPALTLGGFLDLRAVFDDLRPQEENLFQLGEAASGKINGTVLVRGPLRAPALLAENNQAVRVSDALLHLSSQATENEPSKTAKPVNPSFNIPFVLDGTAVLTNPALFRFEAVGQGNIGGSLALPNVTADIITQGGYFNLPTARFRVQKSGIVRLRYNLTDASVRAENITAKARVYTAANAAALSSYAAGNGPPGSQGLPPVSQTQTPGAASNAYNITLTLNGPLNVLEGSGGFQSGEQASLTFTSDPPLSSTEIVALLGTQQQVDQARNGNVEGAFRGIAQQALLSSYLPQYLSPFTQGLQNSLGLADLTLDYNPNGTAGVYAAKAFNRFLLEYNQTVSTRNNNGSTQRQPYSVSFSYDLFRLRPSNLIQPRVQVGTSTNEQHIQTYFLRGKVIF